MDRTRCFEFKPFLVYLSVEADDFCFCFCFSVKKNMKENNSGIIIYYKNHSLDSTIN